MKDFGLDKNSTAIIVALFDASEEKIEKTIQLIKGRIVPFSEISTITNPEQIIKVSLKKINLYLLLTNIFQKNRFINLKLKKKLIYFIAL